MAKGNGGARPASSARGLPAAAATPTPSGTQVVVPTNTHTHAELREVSIETWSLRDEKARQEFLLNLDENYNTVLGELFDEANRCVKTVTRLSASHYRWRRWILILTGLMAVINVLAAYKWDDVNSLSWLSLLAAAYATVLASLASLEGFYNFEGRAQAHRESREMFLDAYRECEMLWHVNVRPFGDSPEACLNAAALYQRLIKVDADLRGKVRDLTTSRKYGSQEQ